MGIQVEFNPDLALRDISHAKHGDRNIEECIPEALIPGEIYPFLKKGQRNFYLLHDEPIPLIETDGNGYLSRPYAAIRILEATHYNQDGTIWTRGFYQVLKVFNQEDSGIHFEGFLSVK